MSSGSGLTAHEGGWLDWHIFRKFLEHKKGEEIKKEKVGLINNDIYMASTCKEYDYDIYTNCLLTGKDNNEEEQNIDISSLSPDYMGRSPYNRAWALILNEETKEEDTGLDIFLFGTHITTDRYATPAAPASWGGEPITLPRDNIAELMESIQDGG